MAPQSGRGRDMFNLSNCLVLSVALFSIGAFGVLARRNLLIVLMSVELMLNAANLALVAFSRHFAGGGAPLALSTPASADGGQVLALISMAVAACEVAVGLDGRLGFHGGEERLGHWYAGFVYRLGGHGEKVGVCFVPLAPVEQDQRLPPFLFCIVISS